MGAFLFIRKGESHHDDEIDKLYSNAIDIFDKKGLILNKKVSRNDFVIYLFYKYSHKIDNIIEYDNNDFIISTGSCIYNGRFGFDALKDIYNDFIVSSCDLPKIFGNFCIMIYYNGKLFISNDYTGLYHVYHNNSKSIVSSSFLAVVASLKDRSISSQEIYEYAFYGAFYGDKTYFRGIDLLDSRYFWQLTPFVEKLNKHINIDPPSTYPTLEEWLQLVSDRLLDIFNIVNTDFSDNCSMALTGGYDTRLLLSIMKKLKIKPYLYVYGDKSSSDVKCAKIISSGERIELDVIDRDNIVGIEPEEYIKIFESNYYINDGLGSWGCFDNGMDVKTRIDRSKKGALNINGAGAGNLINFYLLPDKSYSIRNILRSKYDNVDYSICTNEFNKSQYFEILEDKINNILNVGDNILSRNQVELFEPLIDSKYWMGINNSINSQLSYTLTPFADLSIVEKTVFIPVNMRNYDKFKILLNKYNDPILAKYPSVYGYNFYDGSRMRNKLMGYLKINTPIFIRPYIRKKLSSIRMENKGMPFYFGEKYLNMCINIKDYKLSKYINIHKIKNQEILSRVLTMEYMLKDK